MMTVPTKASMALRYIRANGISQKDNTELTLTTSLIPFKFRIDYFDKNKRIMTYKDLGTFTYIKVKDPEKIE